MTNEERERIESQHRLYIAEQMMNVQVAFNQQNLKRLSRPWLNLKFSLARCLHLNPKFLWGWM